MENEGHQGTIVRWDLSEIRRQKKERWLLTYRTLPMLLFFSCSSRRARRCSSARDISSSMLLISSLARRRFSWKSNQIKRTHRKTLEMCFSHNSRWVSADNRHIEWPKVCGHITLTCDCLTSYSKTTAINMLLQQTTLLQEGLAQNFRTWL